MSLTPDQISIWRESLRDLNPDQLAFGIKAFCRAHEDIYPGTNIIAKIRKFGLRHFQRETAADAWGKAFRLIRAGGGELENKVAARVVRNLGGWATLGNSQNVEADRAHFFRMYDEIIEQENLTELIGE